VHIEEDNTYLWADMEVWTCRDAVTQETKDSEICALMKKNVNQ